MLRPSLLYQVDKSVQGDELAYVFGLPLAPTAVRPGRHFTFDEKRLSEQVITFWTNFAKTGYASPRHALRLSRSFQSPLRGHAVSPRGLLYFRVSLQEPQRSTDTGSPVLARVQLSGDAVPQHQ